MITGIGKYDICEDVVPVALVLSEELVYCHGHREEFALAGQVQRCKEVAPYCHELQDKAGYKCWFHKRHDDLEEQAQRSCTIDNRCLVQFNRNGYYEVSDRKYTERYHRTRKYHDNTNSCIVQV